MQYAREIHWYKKGAAGAVLVGAKTCLSCSISECLSDDINVSQEISALSCNSVMPTLHAHGAGAEHSSYACRRLLQSSGNFL